MVALVATQKHEEMVFFSLSILRSRSKDLVLFALEPVCCKKQQKKFLTNYWFAE